MYICRNKVESKTITMRHIIATSCALIISASLFAQQVNDDTYSTGQDRVNQYNVITTAVSFLTITPDSRSGAMGDAGVATSTDAWSQHSNASKYALADGCWTFIHSMVVKSWN